MVLRNSRHLLKYIFCVSLWCPKASKSMKQGCWELKMGWYWDILHGVFRMFTEELGWFVQNVELESCIHLYWNCRLFSGQFCGNAICSWKDYIYIYRDLRSIFCCPWIISYIHHVFHHLGNFQGVCVSRRSTWALALTLVAWEVVSFNIILAAMKGSTSQWPWTLQLLRSMWFSREMMEWWTSFLLVVIFLSWNLGGQGGPVSDFMAPKKKGVVF